MKRIIICAALLLGSLFPAAAQSTKAQLNTEVSTNFPDNSTGLITPAILRTTVNDFISSWQQATTVNAQVGTTYAIVVGDYGKLVTFNNANPVSVTLPQATGSFTTFNVFVKNLGAGTVTITPTTSTINGGATLSLTSGNSAQIVSDGVNYQTWGTSVGGGSGVSSIGGATGVITLGDGMLIPANVLSPGPSTPRMWQPQANNCDSGHQVWYIDENFCAKWDQSFVTNDDPSVLVAIPIAGTAGPTGASQTLTFTFGAGACAAGCAATYTFQATAFTASISGTTMTVTSVPSGTLQVGMAVTGTGVAGGTVITGPIPGQGIWGGGAGVYTVNNSQTLGSRSMTGTDTLNSIAWGMSNAIKANANLYNPTAVNTSQQRQIIWSTANTPAPQISMDIDGRTSLKIVSSSAGGSTVTSVPPVSCGTACALTMDVGMSVTYSRIASPSFIPVGGSNIFQEFYAGTASGGTGIYAQIAIGITDPTISLGNIFLSGQWGSGITSGVYISRGLYSVSNTDGGADTATFTSFIGTNYTATSGVYTDIRAGLGTTTADGYVAVNNAAAAAGAQQFSPRIRISGQGWQTTSPASEQVDWTVLTEPVQGTTHPTSNLTYNFQVNGGGYTQKAKLSSGGIWDVATGYTINGSAASGHTLVGNGTSYVDGSFAQIIPISSGTLTQAQNTTQFVLTLSNAVENQIEALCPKSGTFKNLFVQTANAPAAGQTVTLTMRVNHADTSLTCTITGTGTTCNDTTHTAACTAGQTFSLKSVTSATTGTINGVSAGAEFDNP